MEWALGGDGDIAGKTLDLCDDSAQSNGIKNHGPTGTTSKFVGGAVAGLLITDPGQPAIRPTEDVDMIIHATARADYQKIEAALRERGFVNDTSRDAPICRWRVGGVTVDVMPTLKEILGFSNPWYPHALATAQATNLPEIVDDLEAALAQFREVLADLDPAV